MTPIVADIIARIPDWTGAKDLKVEPFGGLTNTNYLVTVNGEQFVLRVSGGNGAALGIDRESELEALTAVSAAGIGAEVVDFLLPEGHLITRRIAGRHWTFEEYCKPENLRRAVEAVRQVHTLPAVEATFSPFRRVEKTIREAEALAVPFPADFASFIQKMQAIEEEQRRDASSWLRFCHNDLFSVNFLDDGSRVRIIDWEFAGMNDLYFDLATLVYAYDSEGPLSPELEALVLERYFGEANAAHQARLDGMKFMLLFFTAMWGLVQHGLQQTGAIAPIEGFDCLAYSAETFASMREIAFSR